MNTPISGALRAADYGLIRGRALKEYPLPSWLFHDQDLIPALESARRIDRNTLINLINYIHFAEKSFLAHLRHKKYGEHILVRAYPKPCDGDSFSSHWANGDLSELKLKDYKFLHLVIEDGKSMIVVPAKPLALTPESLTVKLPETSYAISRRQTRRHDCRDVVVELTQNELSAWGELVDFNSSGFRIKVSAGELVPFDLFDLDKPVTVHLSRDRQVFFSGVCRCIRQHHDRTGIEVVVASEALRINRFKQRLIRNPRQQLVTSASIVFEHPLLRKRVELDVHDISTSGLCVYEKADEEMLIPGLIIPELTIIYAGALRMKCSAQIIYRLEVEQKGIRCGLAILDMDIDSYSRLAHIIANTLDPNSFISSDVDMDGLWRFFFETGFINPSKYHLMHSNRENLKAVYRKLYQENPEIARHFIYQKEGVICGHISMVRAYDRAWMIHHHAARVTDNWRNGFLVLRQLMHYVNDMHRLPSTKADYVFSYFRPDNKFPNIVFGGFARGLADPQRCTMDLFAYLPHGRPCSESRLEGGWSLHESSEADLKELRSFYEHNSGGLMLDAFALGKNISDRESLEELYFRLGFVRRVRLYTLAYNKELRAILLVNLSDKPFNLSGLLNCIKVMVANSEGLSWGILARGLSVLATDYEASIVPIMIYPFEYAEENLVPYEKQYQLWIVNLKSGGGDAFMEYMQRRFRACYGERKTVISFK